ncbi:hypothetical protein AB9T88_01475 [Flavobacterium sp. LBUM151]
MKRIFSVLFVVIIAFFVFRYCLFKVQDYINNNSCNSSQFVADGGKIYISFYRNTSKTKRVKNFQIILAGKDGKTKKVKYQKIKDSDNKYYIDYKVLKSDTLIIEAEENKKYKFFDFKNTATRIKAGKDRGKYYCNLYYNSIPSGKDFQKTSEDVNTIDVFLR